MKFKWYFRIWKDDDVWLIQGMPPLDNVLTYGDNIFGAFKNAKEALLGVVLVMLEHNKPLPGARIRPDNINGIIPITIYVDEEKNDIPDKK